MDTYVERWRQSLDAGGDLVCFAHLRWDFVFQRPQHLLSRAARSMRVLYWEEPVWTPGGSPHVVTRPTDEGVLVLQPHIPHGFDTVMTLRALLDDALLREGVADPVLWFYTPHALGFAGHVPGRLTVYDCMDELSAFADADPALPEQERALMRRADLVFTGGQSLYEAKRRQHADVHAFPSGVDTAHFGQARDPLDEPADQIGIPMPRAGFYGVIDERLDQDLLAAVAALRPNVQFVLLGPIAKIDPATLPQRPNLHYLGAKHYEELPAYVAHWQAALMPFAINAATRYISPTKTPEYLAAGLPVVSTPITDVVQRYGPATGVHVADEPQAFAAGLDEALAQRRTGCAWRDAADLLLRGMGWDGIWSRMAQLMKQAEQRQAAEAQAAAAD